VLKSRPDESGPVKTTAAPTPQLVEAGGRRFWAASTKGTGRAENQDAWVLLPSVTYRGAPVIAAAVFDGMGGLPNGGGASKAACKHLEHALAAASGPRSVIRQLSTAVLPTGGGSTATILLLPHARPDDAIMVWIGDSKAWIATRDGRLNPLPTYDVEPPNRLTDFLGRPGAHGHWTRLGPWTRILLATDGVHAALGDETIRTLVLSDERGELAASLAARLARAAPADDATFIFCQR
jgi:serine/threonine protein phosphatase PrpC